MAPRGTRIQAGSSACGVHSLKFLLHGAAPLRISRAMLCTFLSSHRTTEMFWYTFSIFFVPCSNFHRRCPPVHRNLLFISASKLSAKQNTTHILNYLLTTQRSYVISMKWEGHNPAPVTRQPLRSGSGRKVPIIDRPLSRASRAACCSALRKSRTVSGKCLLACVGQPGLWKRFMIAIWRGVR